MNLHLHRRKSKLLTATLVAGGICLSSSLEAKTYSGVLSDPVVLGAWIYEGKCFSCHGDYGSAKLAQEYDDQEELVEAIGSGGCPTTWARKNGGPLGHKEINSLVRFMTKWDEEGGRPDMPTLPPQPKSEELTVKPPEKKRSQELANTEPTDTLSVALKKLIKNNSVARGAYLYTMNCYRCHIDYEHARLGNSMERDTVYRFISEGKTSTQMTPFSRRLGGNLRNSEINSIVDYITTWEQKGEPLAIAKALLTPPQLDPTEFVPIKLTQFKRISGDNKNGELLYRYHCSSCHGTQKEGVIAPSLSTSKTLRSDLYYKAVIKKGVIGSLMPAWDQGENKLSPKEIDDTVSYLDNR